MVQFCAIIIIAFFYILFFRESSVSTFKKVDTKILTINTPDKKYYKSISTNFLAMFLGFVDGDGYIMSEKNGKYFKVYLAIEVHIRDMEVLQYFKNTLKIGRIAYLYPISPSRTYAILFIVKILKAFFLLYYFIIICFF